MRKIFSGLLLLAVTSPSPLWAAATIKELDLADGYDDNNTIGTPLFDTASALPLRLGTVEAGYELKKNLIVRRGPGGFMTKGPEYKLDESIDLAVLLTQALRAEAPTMGFRNADPGEDAWEVEGTLTDIYLESKQVYMGATLFWGYMDVELQVRKGADEPQTIRLRAHSYYGAYSGGMGRKDEAREGLTQLLLEGGQEILSRLNRVYFQAPASPDVEGLITNLSSASRNDVHRVGLSGSPAAVEPLLQLIPRTEDENDRAALIDALARIGSPEAMSTLVARYDEEDEDCRWYTIKAMDYIGGEEAMALIENKGTKDDDDACKRLAKRILGK